MTIIVVDELTDPASTTALPTLLPAGIEIVVGTGYADELSSEIPTVTPPGGAGPESVTNRVVDDPLIIVLLGLIVKLEMVGSPVVNVDGGVDQFPYWRGLRACTCQ